MSMSLDPTVKVILRNLSQLAKDEAGSMTVYTIVFFVLLTAVGGLAVDLGRYYGVHGQMQAFVDDVALAGAAELDGNLLTHPLCRAVRAATGYGISTPVTGCIDDPSGALVSGTQNFAALPKLDIQQLTFFDVLSTDPTPPAPTPETPLCTWTSTSPHDIACTGGKIDTAERSIRIVEVLASPRSVSYVVLPVVNAIMSLGGAPSSSPALALHATAGFKEEVCGATPILICNPQESAGFYRFALPANGGRQLRLTVPASGPGTWQPGDFALIGTGSAPSAVPSDAGGSCGGDPLCMLGRANPLTQCIANRVDAQNAPAAATAEALNTRFDIYDGTMTGHRTDPNFAPSANVTKGICQGGANCDYSGSACSLTSFALPQPSNWKGQWKSTTAYATGDIVIDSGPSCSPCGRSYLATATSANQRPPNAAYWAATAPPWGSITMRLPRDRAFQTDTPPATRVGTDSSTDLNDDLTQYWSADNGGSFPPPGMTSPYTRYGVYQYEIANALPNKYSLAPKGENGANTCSKQVGIGTNMGAMTRDRRVLTVPIVNCLQNSVTWGKTNIPVLAFFQLFLSEPVGLNAAGAVDTTKTDVYAEFIDIVKPGNDGKTLRDLAQLYR